MNDPKTTRFANHADEINHLLGIDDRAYVDAVQGNFYAQEAGRHVRRMLGALILAHPADALSFDLACLAAEYDTIAEGRAVVKGATVHATPCDCSPEHPTVRDARCTTKGTVD